MNNYMKFAMSIAVSSVLLSACGTDAGKNADKETAPKAINKANMDLSVKPGDNFFEYASGGWIKNNPVPGDKTQYGSFTMLYDESQKHLKEIVLKAAEENAPEGSIAQKIGDYYKSGMDTTAINKLGFKPIVPTLDAVKAMKSTKDLMPMVASFQKQGISTMFHFFGSQDPKNSSMMIGHIYQGGLGLPDKDYYLNTDPRITEIRNAYEKHIVRMFKLIGESDIEARLKASSVMQIETELAKISFSRLENRDPVKTYNKMSVKDLSKLGKNLAWNDFFKAIGMPNPGDIDVHQVPFVKGLSKLVKSVEFKHWKNYLQWKVLNGSANYLSSDLEKADFDFYSTTLSGQQQQRPRWKRILGGVNGAMGEALGKLYVEKYFPAAAKQRMEKLVENLRVALGHRIDKLTWMSDDTKALAQAKLASITVKIGYPEKWLDYGPLKVTADNFYQNVRNARMFAFQDNINKIGKPYDKLEWGMTPQTVNAYYSPTANEIVFPAAILQPPFFYMNEDDAVNYGGIGVVIGHEITHGFDDQGRRFDKDGNLNDWWKEDDSKRFGEKAEVFAAQFNNYTVLDSLHVDGHLTMGENIADLGGLNISWDAYQMTKEAKDNKAIDGFTPAQRFFLSY
ncbi:MAG: peptidase M13, partial [Bacteroidia bacterium]